MILQKKASLNQYIFGLSPVLDSVFISFLFSTGTKYVFIVRARPGMLAMSTAPPALIHPSTSYKRRPLNTRLLNLRQVNTIKTVSNILSHPGLDHPQPDQPQSV